MKKTQLGSSDLYVPPICLGTMTFGEQVDEPTAHRLLDHALARGVTFWDTAEMYPIPARAKTFQLTETLLGNWISKNPGLRDKLTLSTKVAGPSRGMPWIRGGATNVTAQDIIDSCEGSLRRLNTDVIDLYQLHWPSRNTPMFGTMYFDPTQDQNVTSMHDQLEALGQLIKAGKVRAVGLSNETPYGICEFIKLSEQHGLPRVATIQNAYNLLNRTHENGMDEAMHRLGVSLLAYSPLAFGLLTGKYDTSGVTGPNAPNGRIALFESVRNQRWGRPDALAAARRYNSLARDNNMSPAQMALAFCNTKWQVASTIIGVTTQEQLDENINAFETVLPTELLQSIDTLRYRARDPAQ
jgi:aryl-alcohol dehydrogenase-like predicted oxidoreductase